MVVAQPGWSIDFRLLSPATQTLIEAVSNTQMSIHGCVYAGARAAGDLIALVGNLRESRLDWAAREIGKRRQRHTGRMRCSIAVVGERGAEL